MKTEEEIRSYMKKIADGIKYTAKTVPDEYDLGHEAALEWVLGD